jgi:hypothetical protein
MRKFININITHFHNPLNPFKFCKNCKRSFIMNKFNPKQLYCTDKCYKLSWDRKHPESIKKYRQKFALENPGYMTNKSKEWRIRQSPYLTITKNSTII